MVASKFIQPDGHLLIDESNINEVSKADLMDYMNYVVSIVPHGFVDLEEEIPVFLKRIQYKKKMDIVNIINYGLHNRFNTVNFQQRENNNSIRVSVKKLVKKVVE